MAEEFFNGVCLPLREVAAIAHDAEAQFSWLFMNSHIDVLNDE